MQVTVGGSFHEPGWTSVMDTVKKLQTAGHQVLAPGAEWEPININDTFVKFKGEENASIEDLQKGFFSCIDKSDVYVISNPNSYEGFMVSIEFGYATYSILNSSGPLSKICFTNTPLGYDKFSSNLNLSFDEFLENLYSNSNYKNELAFYRKTINSNDPNFRYTCERDFYDDLKDMYGKVSLLHSRGNLIFGLDSLLNKSVSQTTPHSKSNDDEREF